MEQGCCRTEIHTPKAATYEKRHGSDSVKYVGRDQMIKTKSMGTVKLTTRWDITEFLTPMIQKDKKQTKNPNPCVFIWEESQRRDLNQVRW